MNFGFLLGSKEFFNSKPGCVSWAVFLEVWDFPLGFRDFVHPVDGRPVLKNLTENKTLNLQPKTCN